MIGQVSTPTQCLTSATVASGSQVGRLGSHADAGAAVVAESAAAAAIPSMNFLMVSLPRVVVVGTPSHRDARNATSSRAGGMQLPGTDALE